MADDLKPSTTELGYLSPGAYYGQLLEENAAELRWPNSTLVYNRMRREDTQVKSVLRAITLPVLRTRWQIDPNGARDEVVAFVSGNLGLPVLGGAETAAPRVRGRFSWTNHLRQALIALALGHAYFEQVYRLDADGRARLHKLAMRPASTISRIEVARDGGLDWIEQRPDGRATSSTSSIKIPVSRLVAYVNEQEAGDWIGTSVLRSCYKHWLIKDELIRVQAQTIRRNGMGVPIYTAAPDEDSLDRGTKLARSFRSGSDSGAGIPNGAKVELQGVKGQLPDIQAVIDYHDSQIARSVLAHFLNLDGKGGSYALAETQADLFIQSLQTQAEWAAETANAHVVEDLVDVNFGVDEPAPRLVCEEIGATQQATAEALRALADAKLIFPDRRLEEALRRRYSLPAKDPNTSTAPSTDGGTA